MQNTLSVPYFKDRTTIDKRLSDYTQNRIAGMNMAQSAREAGYPPSVAAKADSRVEPKAQEHIKQALISKGVSNERIAAVIEAGLSAEKYVKDVGNVVDFKERRETARLVLEVTEQLRPGNTVAVQINFPAGLAEMLAKDAEEYDPSK